MSISNQPIKLNYAKGRQKSKTKNQLESQQKIAFQAESATDIFAHLNQDNLNYIKKQLKHKKTVQSTEKGKNLNQSTQEKRDFMKIKDHEKQFKMYNQLKNNNDLKQKSTKQKLQNKNIQMSDSIMAESVQETTAPEIQKRKQQNYFSEKKQNQYQGLYPPPLTLLGNQQKMKIALQNQRKKQKDQLLVNNLKRNSVYLPVKNNFLEYQLKSETSNNQLAQSSLSQQKQTSQNLSLNQKGSQFIGYLDSYIEQLNGTAAKKFVRGKQSQFKKEENNKQVQREMKNIMKKKQRQSQYQQAQSILSDQIPSHNPISINKNQDSRKVGFHTKKNHQRASILYNSTQNQSPTQRQNDSNFQDLKRQLQRQKYYCTKLALELQKYKQNETKNEKQINLLQKTINLLKNQVENVKELYENQSEQMKKILSYFQMHKQKDEQTKRVRIQSYQKNNRLKKMSRQKYDKQPQLNFQKPFKSFNQLNSKRSSIHKNQFQNFMRLDDPQKTYSQLKSSLFNQLMNQFQKGQQAYHDQKQTARIKLSQRNNELSRSQRYFDKYEDSEPVIKRHSKFQESSDKQRNYLQNLFKLNGQYKKSQERRKSKIVESISSSSSDQIQRKLTSLEKLKKQYQLFKAQAQTVRIDEKNYSQKSSSLKNHVSPKQFSHIYVK